MLYRTGTVTKSCFDDDDENDTNVTAALFVFGRRKIRRLIQTRKDGALLMLEFEYDDGTRELSSEWKYVPAHTINPALLQQALDPDYNVTPYDRDLF